MYKTVNDILMFHPKSIELWEDYKRWAIKADIHICEASAVAYLFLLHTGEDNE